MNSTYFSISQNGSKAITLNSVASELETNGTDLLSISYSPKIKLLSAHWLKPVKSAEYRQSVRMIARTIAFLRAELVLIDVSSYVTLTEADRNWTAAFLSEALGKSSIRRSARVVDAGKCSPETIQQLNALSGKLPYEVGLFHDIETAKRWLLEGIGLVMADKGEIHIPLNFNLKMIRKEMLNKAAAAKPVVSAQTDVEPSTVVAFPEKVSIRTEYMSIAIERNESLMSLRWKKPPTSRQYRYAMLKACRALIEYKLEMLLLNNQNLGVLTMEDQGWLVSSAIELLPKSSLKKMAVVTSADALQQMSSESIGCRLQQAKLPHVSRYFFTEEDAKEWLLSGEEALLT